MLGKKIREYQPITQENEIIPKCIFVNDYFSSECKIYHLLYEPFLLGILFTEKINSDYSEKGSLIIFNQSNKENGSFSLVHDRTIFLENKNIFLYNVETTRLEISIWKKIYLRYLYYRGIIRDKNFLEKFDFRIYKKLVLIFSIPKKVWLVSIYSNEKDKTFSFPIDLCVNLNSHFLLGIRSSNIQANNLQIGETFHIALALAENLKDLYSLGKFNSNKRNLSDFIKTDSHTKIPSIVSEYYALELLDVLDLNYQKIYITKKIHEKKLNHEKCLYHIHKIWYDNYYNDKNIDFIFG